MNKSVYVVAMVLAGIAGSGCTPEIGGGMRTLSREVYRDKCRGAWAGQMIGVTYGDPYQFRINGEPITVPMQPWSPERVAGAIRQDDVYVEMTFLMALEDIGLGITPQQAGEAFGRTEYALWHANKYGRDNIRRGIMPPLSGHPKYNRHADDLDFQIEADVLGVICPGLPRESNRLCDIFGHIMNYGDGVYGGMFVAGMYTAAYFESHDVQKVIRAGLACIPRASRYHQCISDVMNWYAQHPDDWLAVWKLVEDKYNDDQDCIPGDPHNIDAAINGAYIVMGLLYGQGDLLKTIEISTRCGQDADSSTANAGGVIGCMKGYAALGEALTGGIPAVADQKFSYTRYSFNSVVPVCEKMTAAIVEANGGRVTDDAFHIRIQSPRPPETLEQWTNQAELVSVPVTDHEVKLWNPDWQQVDVNPDKGGGFYVADFGKTNVLTLTPIHPVKPAGIARRFPAPQSSAPKLTIEAASEPRSGPYVLKVFLNGKEAHEETVDTNGDWKTMVVDVPAKGAPVDVRIEAHTLGWKSTSGYLRRIELQ